MATIDYDGLGRVVVCLLEGLWTRHCTHRHSIMLEPVNRCNLDRSCYKALKQHSRA